MVNRTNPMTTRRKGMLNNKIGPGNVFCLRCLFYVSGMTYRLTLQLRYLNADPQLFVSASELELRILIIVSLPGPLGALHTLIELFPVAGRTFFVEDILFGSVNMEWG